MILCESNDLYALMLSKLVCTLHVRNSQYGVTFKTCVISLYGLYHCLCLYIDQQYKHAYLKGND